MRLFFPNSFHLFECSCYRFFSTETLPKIYLFSNQLWTFDQEIFVIHPLIMRSTESTGSGFNSRLETCCLGNFPKEVYRSVFFYKHQSELRPFSILSRTGQPQLANFVLQAFRSLSTCTNGFLELMELSSV